MHLRNLESLTNFTAGMVAIGAAFSPAFLLWMMFDVESLQGLLGPYLGEITTGIVVFNIATMIVFSVWIYQAGENLIAAGFENLEYTPGSRIWWFAVPIANLFKPYQAMRELWNASHGSTAYAEHNDVVGLWWALWLASTIVARIIERASGPEGPSLMVSWGIAAVDIASAVAAIVMIRAITAAQGRLTGEELGEVFA